MKRIITLLLVISTLASFTACSDSKSVDTGETAAPIAETAEETTVMDISPNLPALDLGGADFNYLTKMEGSETGRWTAEDIYVEAQNGEVINDAVYRRNQIIQEKHNLVVKQTRMDIGGQYSYTMYNKSASCLRRVIRSMT